MREKEKVTNEKRERVWIRVMWKGRKMKGDKKARDVRVEGGWQVEKIEKERLVVSM